MSKSNTKRKDCHMKECKDHSSSSGWEPKCCEKDCEIQECPEYNSQEIACRFGNAVVEIHSEFILIGSRGPKVDVTGSTPLGTNTRADVILEGNGFFMKGSIIIAPAQLVLMPPSLTAVANRYPWYQNQDLGPNSQVQDVMMRASRILVTVFNVNNMGKSYTYEADLIGVDGAGDIAVLKINYNKLWNNCNPCVEACHPYISYGCSRASNKGEKIYLLGDANSGKKNFNTVCGISSGLLSDNRYVDYNGSVLAETVLVDVPVLTPSAGLPILNSEGRLLGMQTTYLSSDVATFGTGFVAGPSEYFMKHVIKSILKGTCPGVPNCRLEIINDPIGPYLRYKKAYLGIGYNVLTGVSYDYTRDFTSGLNISGAPKIRLSPDGNFLITPGNKEQNGIQVVGLAGLNPKDENGIPNGAYYVPGGVGVAPLPALLPNSPLLTKIKPGDIITKINNVCVGDLHKQIAPSLITWHLCPGDKVEILFRKGGNSLNAADNSMTENFEGLYVQIFDVMDYPKTIDYPWYAIAAFPSLSKAPYPGFVFSLWADSLNTNQLIQLEDRPAFKSAI